MKLRERDVKRHLGSAFLPRFECKVATAWSLLTVTCPAAVFLGVFSRHSTSNRSSQQGAIRACLTTVLAAGLELANEGAMRVVYMKVGNAGVEAMSLYNHAANKHALLDCMAARVMARTYAYSARAPCSPGVEVQCSRDHTM
jgi:hypothetical protein